MAVEQGEALSVSSAQRGPWLRSARALLGLSISALFLALVLSSANLDAVVAAWRRIDPTLIVLAAAISFAEVAVRAARWAILLLPMARVPLATSLAYVGIGHLANTILPARLGDVARAFLAGGRIGTGRITVLGTIATERIADATLLMMVAIGGLFVGYTEFAPAVAALALVGTAVFAFGGLAALILGRRAVVATRVGAFLSTRGSNFIEGARSLRRPRSAAGVALLTLTSFVLAMLIMHSTAAAVGISLPLVHAAVIIAAVTLSTAIPAGPASVGTYEFVGVTVMGSMGYPLEEALLSVALVHVVATLVPATIGLAGMWLLGIHSVSPPAHEPSDR